jgi:Zn-dependent protease with chaperone function
MGAPVLALLLTAAAATAVPQRLPLHRARPTTAAGVLLLSLLVRALLMVALSVLALLRLSEVRAVESLLSWCWHELVPDLPSAFGFAEHSISHAVVAAPLALLAASVAWLAARQLRARRLLRRSLDRSLGTGPWGSTVVHDDGVLLAVTKLGRGRVLVSDRALGELDRGELAAGITHELAHLHRRHRAVLAVGALLGALARLLPGTHATERGLSFQLERDADAYVVRKLHDPLALASAICKAGRPRSTSTALVTLAEGGGSAVLRVRELLEGAAVRSRRVEAAARATLIVLTFAALGLLSSAPTWAKPPDAHAERPGSPHCSHHR